VLKRLKISKRFVLRTTAACLSQIVLKFGLRRSAHSSPNCAKSDPPPVYLSVATFDGKLRLSGKRHRSSHNRQPAYRKPSSLFRMVVSPIPYDLPFPQNGGSAMSPFAKLLWPLFRYQPKGLILTITTTAVWLAIRASCLMTATAACIAVTVWVYSIKTLQSLLLPYGYSYKASCARPG